MKKTVLLALIIAIVTVFGAGSVFASNDVDAKAFGNNIGRCKQFMNDAKVCAENSFKDEDGDGVCDNRSECNEDCRGMASCANAEKATERMHRHNRNCADK